MHRFRTQSTFSAQIPIGASAVARELIVFLAVELAVLLVVAVVALVVGGRSSVVGCRASGVGPRREFRRTYQRGVAPVYSVCLRGWA